MIHSRWSSGDLIFYDGTQDIMTIKDDADGIIFGEDDDGVDIKFFGDTTGAYMLWDADTDDLKFEGGGGLVFNDGDISLGDADYLNFGDAPDVTMRWTTGGVLELLPAAANSDMYLGSTSKPLDVVNYGNITYRAPNSVATTGHITLGSTSNRIQVLKLSTGNTNVLLPLSTGVAGLEFKIFNAATASTATMTIYNGSATGTTVLEVIKNEGAIVISDGASWKGMIGTT